jgi:hypothetical protein
MLTGSFNVSPSLVSNRLNFNFITSLKVCLLFGVVLEIFSFLEASFFYMWSVLLPKKSAALVFSAITWVVMVFLQVLVFAISILWTPNMLNSGFRPAEAFTYAVRQIHGNVFKTLFALAVPLLPYIALMVVAGVLNVRYQALRFIVDAIFYLVIFVYYSALMYTLYFDLTGTERADLKAKGNARKFTWQGRRRK